MNRVRQRPLGIGPLRAFEAVARRLSFSAAADEMHLTQSAVSRQIRGLEDELGAVLFARGTRHVDLTAAGASLLRTVAPLLDRLDATVRQIRVTRGRRHVSVSTFASFASLWLIPRLHLFQKPHPDIDIRISANDSLVDVDDPDLEIALRYCHPDHAPPGALRLFDEVLTPVAGRVLVELSQRGQAPPLVTPADLAGHTLLEDGDLARPSAEFLVWRHWLGRHGAASLEPQRWLYLNLTSQLMQAALAGQGVALARLPLVAESVARGELIEPFGSAGRESSPYAYWLVRGRANEERPELAQFVGWVQEQAAETRAAVAEPGAG